MVVPAPGATSPVALYISEYSDFNGWQADRFTTKSNWDRFRLRHGERA